MRVRFRVDGVLQRGRPRAEADDQRGHLADEDHERARHRREAGARRTAASASTVEDRRVDLRVTTLPTQRGEGATIRILDKDERRSARSTSSAWTASARERFEELLPPGLRRGAGHRPDRLGQVDDPLRGAPGAERGREEHHHDRGPGRVPARRDQPDQRQPQGRARLRHRPALDPPRRPRHRHGRRDPRRRDRRGSRSRRR